MEEPKIAQKGPYALDMEPGTYYWCSCGRSTNQPFCSGAHKGTTFTPIKVEITEAKIVYFCGCKRSGTKPFCDGNHKNL